MKIRIVGVVLTVLVMATGCQDKQISSDNENIQVESGSAQVVRGNHPRIEGIWPQYTNLDTALRSNIVFSDTITPDAPFQNWKGEKVDSHDLSNQTPDNYDDFHNHYQNVLSEVMNFKEGTNAVSIWGDSAAVANNSKAWGGFFSARSDYTGFKEGMLYEKYLPDDLDISGYTPENYDAQLVGLEIDILNGGKPGVYPNKSKVGLQIVGFGNPNSMAIEVRSEDTDKDVEDRRGLWESGIYFKNSIADYGRLIVADFEQAKMGLDFRKTLFTEGVAQVRSEGVGTGIIFNEGIGGEMYSGLRWQEEQNPDNWLTLRAGTGGLRVSSNDNTKELIAIDNYGDIYLNGEVYVNGKSLNELMLLEGRVEELENTLQELLARLDNE